MYAYYKVPFDTPNVDHLTEYQHTLDSLRRLQTAMQVRPMDASRAKWTREYLLDKCGKIDIHLSSKDLMKAQLYHVRKLRRELELLKALYA
jgi:hypothetical protein